MDSRPLGLRLLAKIDEWPESWIGEDTDWHLGREVVCALRPFLASVVSSTLAATTLRRHFANVWLLGGEIVRAASEDTSVRRLEGKELLLRFVDDEGGPILRGYSTESEQRSFDGTCRKIFKFLTDEAGSV